MKIFQAERSYGWAACGHQYIAPGKPAVLLNTDEEPKGLLICECCFADYETALLNLPITSWEDVIGIIKGDWDIFEKYLSQEEADFLSSWRFCARRDGRPDTIFQYLAEIKHYPSA